MGVCYEEQKKPIEKTNKDIKYIDNLTEQKQVKAKGAFVTTSTNNTNANNNLLEISGGEEKKKQKQILHYNVLATCGIGFYSKVYLCESTKNKKLKFAIKTLKKKNLENEKAKFHVSNEIKILNNLKFDFIIPINDIFELNCREYIVYPYYNLDLYVLIKLEKKKIPETIIRIIISQIYSCLCFLHNNKIIFRDLKPENVMLDIDNGTIKLIDFGLAFLCDKTEETKELCGTNEYIPPEVINKCAYSYDFDEWTFGILCYEIVFGKTPFHGSTQEETFYSILHDELEFPNREDISEELLDLLSSLIKKEKNERMEWDNIPYHPFFNGYNIFEYIGNLEETKVNQGFRDQLKKYLVKYKDYSEYVQKK